MWVVSNTSLTSRVLAHLQGGCHWLRCNGLHRLLCETHPHPNVRGASHLCFPCSSHLTSSNNILVYVSRLRVFSPANVLQQRWSIMGSGLFTICMLSWHSVYPFRSLSAIVHQGPLNSRNRKMNRVSKPQCYYWTSSKPNLGDGFTTSTAGWYSCPPEGFPRRNKAAALSTFPVRDGYKNAKSIWVRASTSVSCAPTCSLA